MLQRQNIYPLCSSYIHLGVIRRSSRNSCLFMTKSAAMNLQHKNLLPRSAFTFSPNDWSHLGVNVFVHTLIIQPNFRFFPPSWFKVFRWTEKTLSSWEIRQASQKSEPSLFRLQPDHRLSAGSLSYISFLCYIIKVFIPTFCRPKFNICLNVPWN